MFLIASIHETHIDSDVYRAVVVVFIILVFMKFILIVVQKFLDHRLKNEMIKKGISDDIASTLLHQHPKDTQEDGLKWVMLLLTSAVGIFIVNQTQPLGLHSISIMLASVGVGYMAYLGGLRIMD